MEVKDWVSLGAALVVPTIYFIFGYSRLITKFETHEEADKKMFNKLEEYSNQFFTRITKIEISNSEKAESLKNLAFQYGEIRGELMEIKNILLRKYNP